MAKKRLGTNLNALLGGANLTNQESVELMSSMDATVHKKSQLPVDVIVRGKYQPRRDMHPDALEDLAESIKVQGVIQPIIVRPIDQEYYEIIAGERRWRAAQLAGLSTIPVVIKEVEDHSAIAMALIENIQREDLNPMEEAFAFSRLQKEFGLTQAKVAEAVGKSRTSITNMLRLISLEDGVKRMLEYGDLEMGHARALLTLSPSEQLTVAQIIVSKSLSVRQTEAEVRKIQNKPEKKTIETEMTKILANIQHLENSLSDKVGAQVFVKYNKKGKGKIVISYNSLDELDGILAHIK